MLSQLEIKNKLVPKDKPYIKADGGGLALLVQPNGAKLWRLRYRFAGKAQMLSLGSWPEVSLADARAERDRAKASLRAGINPSSVRKEVKARAVVAAASTFRALAVEWIDQHREVWAAAHLQRVQSQLDRDILPSLGNRPISEITPAEVLAMVKRVEGRGSLSMAKRCLDRTTDVFALGVRTLRCPSNPARDLVGVLKTRKVTHHAALSFDQLPTFYERLEALSAGPELKGAMEMAILTATRSGEARGMRWDELDLNAKAPLWRIPAERMKMANEHLVPLSRQAVAILERMRPLSGDGALVFPSPSKPKEPLTANALLMALWRMGYAKGEITMHGFRATFSTTLNELGHNPDVIERALAHLPADKVRAAYHRAQYLDERRKLLQAWADMIDGKRAGGGVVPIRRRAG
jgi:integrase